jgi:hypothetical protein
MDFQLEPFGQPRGDGQARQANGFFGVHRSARIRQQQVTARIDKLEDVGKRILFPAQIGAAQRHRHHLRSARFERFAHHFRRRKLARSQNQAGTKDSLRNNQRLVLQQHPRQCRQGLKVLSSLAEISSKYRSRCKGA